MTTPNPFTPPPGPSVDPSLGYGSTPAPAYGSAPADGYASAPATGYESSPGYGAYPVATTQQSYQNGPSGLTRSPIGVFLLTIVTFGIYGIIWYYQINTELRNFNSSIRVNPTNMILLCLFVPLFMVFSVFYTGQRIQQAQAAAGLPAATSPGTGVLLAILIGGHSFYYQEALNSLWQHRQA